MFSLTNVTECVARKWSPPSTFNHQTCLNRYDECFASITGSDKLFTGVISLDDCNLNCGPHRWYNAKEFIDRVHWLLPVILLAGNLQLPPLGLKVKAFTVAHLLGDPIDSILSLKHTLRVKDECKDWATRILASGTITDVSASALAELAFALDNLQASSSPRLREVLERLFGDEAFEDTGGAETLREALRVAGEDLRTTRVTTVLPTVVAIFFFVVNIINELVDSALSSDDTSKKPGNRIAFAMLFSWMLPAVLLSTACHRYCEANSCWRAIERFLSTVGRRLVDLGLDAGVFPEDRAQAPASAPYSGMIHSFRPEKMHLRWMTFQEQWREAQRQRREILQQRRAPLRRAPQRRREAAVREWVLHGLRSRLPTVLAIIPTLLAFTFAMGISYITPTGEFSMRCVVQFSVFLSWLLSFALTCLGNRWLVRSHQSPPHRVAMVVLWVICCKDVFFAVGTLLAVLLVTGGLLNKCFGWSNGWSGMITGNQYVNLKWEDKLQENLNRGYPAFVASGIAAQVLLFFLLRHPLRNWSWGMVGRLRQSVRPRGEAAW